MAWRPTANFDVSSFISPFRGDPIGAQKLAAEMSRGAAQDALQGMALTAQNRRAREANTIEQQAIGQRASTAYMQQQQANARKKLELEQAMEIERQKRARTQAEAGAGLLGEAAQAQARGDVNALAAIQARAGMLDPMLRMTLPGQSTSRVDPALPSVDEAYPLEPDALTIERGGQQLYGAQNADVRQREQDIVGRAIHPLRNSPFAADYAPAFEAGMGLAGAGMTGADAVKAAMSQANTEADRAARIKNAHTMAGAQEHRMGIQDANLDISAHDRVEKLGENVKKNFGVLKSEEQLAGFAELNDMITQGVPFQQNEGLLLILKNTIRGAGSDKDMNQFEGAAGFWNRLGRDFNKVAAGGDMPADFKTQIATALEAQRKAVETKRLRAGLAIRDQIYNASMLPLSDEQRVMEAHRKYGEITGRQLPKEELQRELERFRKQRARGGPASTQALPMPAAGDSLSVNKSLVGPPVNRLSAPADDGDDDDEADDLADILGGD